MIHILQLLLKKYQSTAETLAAIDSISPEDFLISEKTLTHLLNIFKQTRIKLILFFQQYPAISRAPPDFDSFTNEDTISFLVDYSAPFEESPQCGAYYLSALYYKTNGAYHKNARFLFGSASQFLF
jgi:hypothetical protein